MRKYYICPERCRWTETEAANAETAYCAVCHWYDTDTRIAVIDAETGQAAVFTRTLDAAGNLTAVNQHVPQADAIREAAIIPNDTNLE